ncbi:MAG: hypothetical protein SFV55_20155 [Haliscomenobacter sp.]|uniref:type III-A CRISPR-associated protein Cas10/Csm1 n=1 Tax=Haliscomenobacter sp. TaxID=2717303 RepID=UPI0029BC7A4E|nr:hypothetical protein [Haliscomenobacter sp.]MDX2070753.1 hypothetical protein [Haliscomenobacter sp.]
MQSVLGKVWNQTQDFYFPAARLTLAEDLVLPRPELEGLKTDFFDEAKREFYAIQACYQEHEYSASHLYTLYHYAQVWGSRISFAAGSADHSVFDHNRIKAAVEICHQQVPIDSASPFLLLKGAIGGIQKYIYHEMKAEQIGDADKASKRLRGRSFLVAHLSQVLAEQVIENLEQSQAQILFVGGGHFHVMLPNTTSITTALDELKTKINLGLQRSLGTALSFDLVSTACSEEFLTNPTSSFQLLDDQLKQAKQRRHVQYLANVLQSRVNLPDRKEEERIGQKAPYTAYIIEVKTTDQQLLQRITTHYHEGNPKKNKADIECLGFLGLHYFLVKKAGGLKKIALFLNALKAEKDADFSLKIIRLNDTRFLPTTINIPSELKISWGFTFLGNYAPLLQNKDKQQKRGKNSLLMFSELAALDQNGNDKLNYPQLAAMRLDMDDLGVLFSYGLGGDSSIERVLCLSRELQLFFGAYFNVLAEKHHLYITYSGGDDAFVIGSWINVLQFAKTLQKEFVKFTCGNPHLGFSAGIYTCNPHYPVVRFANDAEALQERAKKYQPDASLPGKNAVCVFNQVYSWERFQAMMDFADDLEKVVLSDSKSPKTTGLPIRRSLLQRLLDIIQVSHEQDDMQFTPSFTKKKYQEQKDFEFFRNLGRLHGLMARQGFGVNSLRENSPADRIIRQLLQESRDRRLFVDYKLPFNYILFKTSEAKTSIYGRNNN